MNFCGENCLRLKAVNYCHKKTLSQTFARVLNTSLPCSFVLNIAMRCVLNIAIWYQLHNFKNAKNTHEGALLLSIIKSSTLPWVFFTFFKLYKWYEFAQRITCILEYNDQLNFCTPVLLLAVFTFLVHHVHSSYRGYSHLFKAVIPLPNISPFVNIFVSQPFFPFQPPLTLHDPMLNEEKKLTYIITLKISIITRH